MSKKFLRQFLIFSLLSIWVRGVHSKEYTAVCLDTHVRLWAEPDLRSKVVGFIGLKEEFLVLTQSTFTAHVGGQDHYWFQVARSTGTLGWVFGTHISLLEVDLDDLDKEEAKLLASYPEEVSRHNLLLVVGGGVKAVQFLDRHHYGDGTQRHILVEVKKRSDGKNIFIVKNLYWEGMGCTILCNGKKAVIEGSPIFSPDKNHILASSFDLTAGYQTNSIVIYDTNLSLEFSRTFACCTGPSESKWIDSTTFAYIEQSTDNVKMAYKMTRAKKFKPDWGNLYCALNVS